MDVWAPPVASRGTADTVLPPEAAGRWRTDLPGAAVVVVATVLLGAPAGLLWSAVAPRVSVVFTKDGPQVTDLESTKAFVGADGTFLVVVLLMGLLCGVLAWLFARGFGPWTVGALAVGGLLAALVASRVGLMPGADAAIAALSDPAHHTSGTIDLFLGRHEEDGLHVRAPWAAVGWPVGALFAYLIGAFRWPHELD